MASALTPVTAYDDGASTAAAAVNANAAQVTFTTNAGPTDLITFEGFTPGISTNGLTVAPGVTLGTDPGVGDSIVDSDAKCGNPAAVCGFNITSGGSEWAYVDGGTLTFNFATPITSFGAYLTGVNLGDSIQVGGSDVVSVSNPSFNDGGVAFLGFYGSAPVTQVIILAGGPYNGDPLVDDQIGVDNVQYTAAVPEPATWAMLLLGVGAIGASLRVARRTRAEALSAA